MLGSGDFAVRQSVLVSKVGVGQKGPDHQRETRELVWGREALGSEVRLCAGLWGFAVRQSQIVSSFG